MPASIMALSAAKIAELTGGTWHHLEGNEAFTGIRVNIDRAGPGDLLFTSNPEQWGRNIPDTQHRLQEAFECGIVAAVVTPSADISACSGPVLVVENSKNALERIAYYARDHYRIPRVLVTGTEGKTGFKNQLHFLLSFQTGVHATLDSSNLNVPILCSMASIGVSDRVEVIEASVASGGVGTTRSLMVRPDICVITEVGVAHIATHGSMEQLIHNKASIVEGLKETGICILNADSVNYDRLREAIYNRRYVRTATFGSSPRCDAQLLERDFDAEALLWRVRARIGAKEYRYVVPLLGEHVPLASLAPLLCVHLLGYDVEQAARDYGGFRSTPTMGRLSEIEGPRGRFRFYDHSHRASVFNYRSALQDLARLKPDGSGRKIAVIGNMLNIGKTSGIEHEALAPLIEAAGVQRLYTVGTHARVIHAKLRDPSILVAHGDRYEEISEQLLGELSEGDLLFIKGHHRIWLKKLADVIYALGASHEIR